VAIYETVNAYSAHSQPEFYAQLAAELDASVIVDLGCGTGLITRELARQGYRMIGVDPAPAMLDIARNRPGGDRVEWINGDASAMGTPDADLAIMSGHVAQFFLTDDSWHAALTALRPGGCLAFETRDPDAREWDHWSRGACSTTHDLLVGSIETWSEVHDVHDSIVSYANHHASLAPARS
jgi:SAM-dependent methyltransferase